MFFVDRLPNCTYSHIHKYITITVVFNEIEMWCYLMNSLSNQEKPIYVQIREKIEDQIVNDQLHEGEQAPSTNQLAAFYKINHITVSKGVNRLVEEGILYKKRGIGMFVAEGAKEKLISKRKAAFKDVVIVELVLEAEKLGISESEIVEYIKQVKGRMQSDNGN